MADTVSDIDEDPDFGNGFVFNDSDPWQLLDAVEPRP